jgi:hypothetical protein
VVAAHDNLMSQCIFFMCVSLSVEANNQETKNSKVFVGLWKRFTYVPLSAGSIRRIILIYEEKKTSHHDILLDLF